MTDTTAFQSFKTTHPDLWEQIGVLWRHRHCGGEGTCADGIRYSATREAVCLVGQFSHDLFDAEASRDFDR